MPALLALAPTLTRALTLCLPYRTPLESSACHVYASESSGTETSKPCAAVLGLGLGLGLGFGFGFGFEFGVLGIKVRSAYPTSILARAAGAVHSK